MGKNRKVIQGLFSKRKESDKKLTFDEFSFVKDTSLSKIERHSENGFFALSVCSETKSEAENRDNHIDLTEKVHAAGLGYITLLGGYEESSCAGEENTFVEELSLFVPYIQEKIELKEFKALAERLAKEYEQDGYLIDYGEGSVHLIETASVKGSYSSDTLLGAFETNMMTKYFSLLRAGKNKSKKLEYTFKGYRVPSNYIQALGLHLDGEIF